MKKIMTVLLAICFISGSVLADKTPKFTDLEDVEWAEKYIEKSAELGLVNGYEDGTFKPNAHITKCNSVLMLYRMLDIQDLIDQDKTAKITKKHTKIMNKLYIPPYKNNELHNAIAYFLDNDVLSRKNIETFMGNSEELQTKISRQEIAYYLGRILNKELNGNVNAKLKVKLDDFKDADDIKEDYKPYISFLHEINIIKGDDDGKFNPTSNITRAEFCTIVYRSLDKFETKKIPEKAEIIDINADDKKITFKFKRKGNPKVEKDINRDIKIYLNEKRADFEDLKVGMNVKVIYEKYANKDIKPKFIELHADKINEETKSLGKVKKVNSSKNIIFYDDEHSSNSNKELELDNDTKIFLDKKEVSFGSIRKGQHLTSEYKNDKLFAIRLTSKRKYFKGTITDINTKDDTITIKSEKDTLEFTIPSSCKIRKDGRSDDLENLKVGNLARLTSEYGEIVRLETEPNVKFGVINGVFKGGSNKNTKNSIEILYQDDEVKTYPVGSKVEIKINGKSANSVFDLKVNSSVNLTFDGEELVEIDARSYGNKVGIVGYIEHVNERDKIVIVQTLNNSYNSDNFSYDLLAKDAVILNKKGETIYVDDLKEWQKVFFYGAKDRDADNDHTLKVEKIIILENEDDDEE